LVFVGFLNFTFAQDTIELRYATHITDGHRQYVEGLAPWLKDIEKATKGKVKITPYPSGTLCKGKDTWEAVKGGIADIGTAFIGLFPGRFPVTEVLFLPCISMDPNATAQTSTRAMMEAYKKFPEMQAEYKDVKLMFLHSIQPAFIATKGKPVKTIKDIKGLKLRIPGVYTTKFISAQGGVPILLPPSGIYEAMEKKVIDGYAYSWDGFMSRRMYEVTDSVLDNRWYVGAFFTIMNKNTWNKLPDDVKKAIDSVTGLQAALRCAKAIDHDTAPALAKCKELKIQVFNLTKDQQKTWRQAAKPIWDGWAQDVAKKGVSPAKAQALLKETAKLYEKNAAQ
jgi:TRAP-type C4-dicarboxylate transport system substrate-binding protein